VRFCEGSFFPSGYKLVNRSSSIRRQLFGFSRLLRLRRDTASPLHWSKPMRIGWIAQTAAALFITCATTGCTRDISPTAPSTSVPTAVRPDPGPAAINVTLTGRVIEAPPTSSTGVWDAVVTLEDGSKSWQSTKTIGGVGRGTYSIADLPSGHYRATVTADGFVNVTREINLTSDTTTDFPMLPVAVTKDLAVAGDLKSTDGTCSDGTALKPCHVIAIPVHNTGSIDATLTWRAASPVSLNVTLFKSGDQRPLASSTSNGSANERISAPLAGGALYELRITYGSGTAMASYSLKVAYPN
jgi:hypothetical protein